MDTVASGRRAIARQAGRLSDGVHAATGSRMCVPLEAEFCLLCMEIPCPYAGPAETAVPVSAAPAEVREHGKKYREDYGRLSRLDAP